MILKHSAFSLRKHKTKKIKNNASFKAGSKNFEKLLLTSSCLLVHLSVRMEHLDSHWTESHEM
jgi:hypothetical protein